MSASKTRRGRVVQAERPDWRPLEALVGETVAERFMWMFEVELSDGSSLHAYKHADTREYLHLDAESAAFEYRSPGRYERVLAADALTAVFAPLPGLAGVTPAYIAAAWGAVARLAGRSDVEAQDRLVGYGHYGHTDGDQAAA